MEPLLASLADPDPDTRAAARMALVRAGDEAVAALVQVLASGESRARAEAARALGEIGAARAVGPLLDALAREPYEVASWAARALGAIGDRRAREPLVARLGDEEVRNAVALALGDLGDGAVAPALARALGGLGDRFDYGAYLGRYWLARALVRLGDRSAATVAALREVVDRDFGHETQATWGSLRDDAVDLLAEVDPDGADAFLRPFLRRERETLQLRYHIARRYWLAGERGDGLRRILERMARHPLYPVQSAEARDLAATEN
jgi:HEAT repeat protein